MTGTDKMAQDSSEGWDGREAAAIIQEKRSGLGQGTWDTSALLQRQEGGTGKWKTGFPLSGAPEQLQLHLPNKLEHLRDGN